MRIITVESEILVGCVQKVSKLVNGKLHTVSSTESIFRGIVEHVRYFDICLHYVIQISATPYRPNSVESNSHHCQEYTLSLNSHSEQHFLPPHMFFDMTQCTFMTTMTTTTS